MAVWGRVVRQQDLAIEVATNMRVVQESERSNRMCKKRATCSIVEHIPICGYYVLCTFNNKIQKKIVLVIDGSTYDCFHDRMQLIKHNKGLIKRVFLVS